MTIWSLNGVAQAGEFGLTLDGEVQTGPAIPLRNDRRDHAVRVMVKS